MSARTLPIRLAPIAGEALDSYLEMLASRSHTAWSDMLDAVGLAHSATRSGAGIHSWLVRLTTAQLDALSQATGVSVSRLESMTLAGLCAVLAGAPGSSAPLVPAFRSPARSRYCPHCLRDSGGSWQLWWRLIWAFGCPRQTPLFTRRLLSSLWTMAARRPDTQEQSSSARILFGNADE
ncbi:TniQ family protein [Mycobacterium colombiense]|uniref:TniQ family protein n=1 Tax=Mycobacterium colombiense TaxID=339268 RepID=UPI00156132F3